MARWTGSGWEWEEEAGGFEGGRFDREGGNAGAEVGYGVVGGEEGTGGTGGWGWGGGCVSLMGFFGRVF